MLSSDILCPTPVKMSERRRVRPGIPKKSTVRKALFGPVDHEELQQDLDTQMAILKAADRERWNFDFSGESPLPGRYDWERVEEYSPEIPIAYSMSCLTACGLDAAVPIRYTNSRFVRSTTCSGVSSPSGRGVKRALSADDGKEAREAEQGRSCSPALETRTLPVTDTTTTNTADSTESVKKTIIQAKISTFFPVKRRTTENCESPSKRRRRHLTTRQAETTLSSQ